ncbi:ADP-ribosylglycohydrolase family protein [Flaviflexus massiliensis]|uniref:ADP-ribosylglycohydrolase family protein n=1 Tax=Flaviflexus massiliensis TaxID=1522309 RepID=UPI0006D536DD|nr:ADP-ribosylglycohydrolase family protein [Flaviflexus massiliensis]
MATTRVEERSCATLTGFILGDCLAMPTAGMSPSQVVETYGMISGIGAPHESQPLHAGKRAGEPTFVTTLMLRYGIHLAKHGTIKPGLLVEDIVTWERKASRRLEAQSDCAPPLFTLSTMKEKRYPTRATLFPATSIAGAITIGLACARETDPERLHRMVSGMCQVLDGTATLWQSATLVANVVRAGLRGATVKDALDIAIADTAEAHADGSWSPGASVLTRTLEAIDNAENLSPSSLSTYLVSAVGVSDTVTEAIPAAFALASAYSESPFLGLCTGAQLGGASSTISALTGAIFGACHGKSAFPDDQIDLIDSAVIDQAAQLARALLPAEASAHVQRPNQAR